jgi:glycosyltransferase involved in cell wall biosynthesis
MKVAFIAGVFFPIPGGAQVQVHNIANKLCKLGYDIKLFIYNKTNIKNNNYKIILLNKFLLNIVFFFKYYLNINLFFLLDPYIHYLMKRYNFDIWHFTFLNFKSLILINAIKNFNKKAKVIVTFQGADVQIDRSINYGFRLNKRYNDLLKNTLKNIDIYTYISQTIKKDLVDLGINEERLVYFPNCVNLKKFEQYNSENKINKNKIFNLITVARFAEKKKGFDLIHKIALKIKEKKINFKWKIIGANSKLLLKNDFFKSNADLFELIDNIENIDEEYFPHTNLIKHYRNSDLYINLSRIESFGITYIETLASRVPILSFISKGSNEIIINNFNGFFVAENNLSNFAEKISQLNENQNNLTDIKKNCLESVKKFDLDLISNKLLATYKELL